MTGSFWWDVAVGIAAALTLAWVALIVALAFLRPPGGLVREALRILPDVLRLIRRLAADKTLPSGVRIRLWMLLAYLALPFDLIPDFIPVLGYADDAVIVTAVVRGVVRRAGIVCGAAPLARQRRRLRCAVPPDWPEYFSYFVTVNTSWSPVCRLLASLIRVCGASDSGV